LQQHYALINYFADRRGDHIGGYLRLMEDFPETENFKLDVEQILMSYDERIRLIDAAIGSIQDTLVDLGQWDDTLLVVFSDHGEAFYEHGLERHDYVPFNECLEVPLVISYPQALRDSPKHVVEGLAWHLDLMPTVLGLTGVPAPAGLRGRDLTPVLLGREAIEPERAIFPAVLRPAFLDRQPLRRVVVQGKDKWVEGHKHFGDEQGFLFDLAQDPEELVNLREERRERFDELALMASNYEALLNVRPPVHQKTGLPLEGDEGDIELDLSEQELENLRALGYVGADE
jgi:arylsulfatase A-like enzyme